MSTNTGIEWTDATWNPIRGCSRVSEGCRNCYAEKVAYRFSGVGQPYEGLVQTHSSADELVRIPKWNGMILFVEDHLLDPLKWNPVTDHEPTCDYYLADRKQIRNCGCPTRPRRIFVNSMSDLFHENVTDAMLDRIFAVMALCPQHTFQVLTKRPERMLAYLREPGRRSDVLLALNAICWDIETRADLPIEQPASVVELSDDENEDDGPTFQLKKSEWPLPNIQLGVSVEDQKTADERIPLLLQAPAAVHFISVEPLLGPMDLLSVDFLQAIAKPGWRGEKHYPFPGLMGQFRTKLLHLLDWVIVGGESGPGARPMHPNWARDLRDQCTANRIPFFFKQHGDWRMRESGDRDDQPRIRLTDAGENDQELGAEGDNAVWMQRVGKKAAGRLLDGREWNEMPAVRA